MEMEKERYVHSTCTICLLKKKKNAETFVLYIF